MWQLLEKHPEQNQKGHKDLETSLDYSYVHNT